MDESEVDAGKIRDLLSRVDSDMGELLGTSMDVRNKLYRQRISLERKFMKKIVGISRVMLQKMDSEVVMGDNKKCCLPFQQGGRDNMAMASGRRGSVHARSHSMHSYA